MHSVVGSLEESTYMGLWDSLKPSRMGTGPGTQALEYTGRRGEKVITAAIANSFVLCQTSFLIFFFSLLEEKTLIIKEFERIPKPGVSLI